MEGLKRNKPLRAISRLTSYADVSWVEELSTGISFTPSIEFRVQHDLRNSIVLFNGYEGLVCLMGSRDMFLDQRLNQWKV